MKLLSLIFFSIRNMKKFFPSTLNFNRFLKSGDNISNLPKKQLLYLIYQNKNILSQLADSLKYYISRNYLIINNHNLYKHVNK